MEHMARCLCMVPMASQRTLMDIHSRRMLHVHLQMRTCCGASWQAAYAAAYGYNPAAYSAMYAGYPGYKPVVDCFSEQNCLLTELQWPHVW
eukprot:1661475-Amphidinium_carterae.1